MGPNLPTPPDGPETPGPPPSPLKLTLGERSFSFFPPIRNIHHNEWRFVRETWAETLVLNPQSGQEVWIPRRALGVISSVEEPFPIVGLHQEMEFRAGTVWPYRPKVLSMPRGARDPQPLLPHVPDGAAPRAPVLGNRAEGRVARLIGISLLLGLIGMVVVLAVFRGDGIFGNRVILQTADQEYLSLRAGDDYHAVVQRLGQPDGDRWRNQSTEVAFRVLDYPERAYSVVLFGSDQASVTYIGALDSNWRPIHSVRVGRGVDSTAMLKSLPRF